MKPAYITTALMLAFVGAAHAEPKTLTVTAEGIGSDGYIAPEYAFCAPAEKTHVQDGGNKSIGLSWGKGPYGTRSFTIVAVDTEVPTVFDDAGKEGKTIPASMPRKDFYHWTLVNIPATTAGIAAGADSSGVEPRGKSERQTEYGLRGINDYASYMASDPERSGVYAGYDGPCPPWNDERVHRYHFRVFALDVDKLTLPENFGGPDVMKAMEGHILAQGEILGLYSLNPSIPKDAP